MTTNRIIGDSFFEWPLYIGKKQKFSLIMADPMYDLSDEKKQKFHSEFLELCENGTIAVFSPDTNPWVPGHDEKHYWIKDPSTKVVSKRAARYVEEIFIYWRGQRFWAGKGYKENKINYTNFINFHQDRVDKNIHKFRKPPALIRRFIRNCTRPGDWVLEPFGGSCIVKEICEQEGRNSVSFEIDSGWLKENNYNFEYVPF